MFGQILAVQWKPVKHGAAFLAVIAFGLPLMAVQNLGPRSAEQLSFSADTLFYAWNAWAPAFPVLAALVGAVFGLNAWNWDHKEGHTYPLILPLSRSQYIIRKGAAGAVLLLIPAAGMAAGSVLAAMTLSVPAGLQAYPGWFALRFLVASLVSFSAFFALASGTTRTAILIVSGFAALIAGGTAATGLIQYWVPTFNVNPGMALLYMMMEWPGPFAVFTGNWMLIDV